MRCWECDRDVDEEEEELTENERKERGSCHTCGRTLPETNSKLCWKCGNERCPVSKDCDNCKKCLGEEREAERETEVALCSQCGANSASVNDRGVCAQCRDGKEDGLKECDASGSGDSGVGVGDVEDSDIVPDSLEDEFENLIAWKKQSLPKAFSKPVDQDHSKLPALPEPPKRIVSILKTPALQQPPKVAVRFLYNKQIIPHSKPLPYTIRTKPVDMRAAKVVKCKMVNAPITSSDAHILKPISASKEKLYRYYCGACSSTFPSMPEVLAHSAVCSKKSESRESDQAKPSR